MAVVESAAMYSTTVIHGERNPIYRQIDADGCDIASDKEEPTEVRLAVILRSIDVMGVLHIKSRMTVNAIIAALVEHRDRVWPEC